ncbi:hypothetical protein ACLOJK_022636 [Asimina triloba]
MARRRSSDPTQIGIHQTFTTQQRQLEAMASKIDPTFKTHPCSTARSHRLASLPGALRQRSSQAMAASSDRPMIRASRSQQGSIVRHLE